MYRSKMPEVKMVNRVESTAGSKEGYKQRKKSFQVLSS